MPAGIVMSDVEDGLDMILSFSLEGRRFMSEGRGYG